MSDALGLGTLRETITQYLRDGVTGDIGVFDAIPDSIAPPALYVAWSNPWLAATTFCQYTGMMQVICVAARIEPGGQYSTLESLVSETLSIFHSKRVTVRDVTAPYPIVLGGVNYLAASVNIIDDIGD
jgi:hypothetical protein